MLNHLSKFTQQNRNPKLMLMTLPILFLCTFYLGTQLEATGTLAAPLNLAKSLPCWCHCFPVDIGGFQQPG